MTPSPASYLPDDVELLETLGEGSFGTVIVARVHDGAISRTVVLKVLKRDWSHEVEALRRARDEAAMLARLNHDNIVRVERLTTWRGHVTVVMEHLVGLSLDHVLRHHGPLPAWSALEITSRVCSALDAAFAGIPPGETRPLHIIHRDIKPSNILLTVSGGVKVLDFGAARGEFEEREAETRSMTFGSPLYMAPECFDVAPPTPAVDVFALGATLVELLSGEPLGRLSVSPQRFWPALESRLQQVRPVDLSDGPARDAVLELVSRALRYDPDRRPDAATFRSQLRELMQRHPIPRYGLDQLSETIVEPLYRRRAMLPATPPECTLLAPPGVLERQTPPPSPRITPLSPDDTATVTIRRDGAAAMAPKFDLVTEPKSAAGGAPTRARVEPVNLPPKAPSTPAQTRAPAAVLSPLARAPLPQARGATVRTDAPPERPSPWPAVLSLAFGVVVATIAITLWATMDLAPPQTDASAAPSEEHLAPLADGSAKEKESIAPSPEALKAVGPLPSRTPRPSSAPKERSPPAKKPVSEDANPWGVPETTRGSSEVSGGGTASMRLSEIKIATLPAGASISVKGHPVQTAPYKFTLPAGRHEVVVDFPTSTVGPSVTGSCSIMVGEVATVHIKQVEGQVICP